MVDSHTERKQNEPSPLDFDQVALVKSLLPSIKQQTIGYVAPFLIAVIFVAVIPCCIEHTILTSAFQTLAQIGGVLTGITGLVGLFGMESLRSEQIDLKRRIWDLELEHLRTHISNLRNPKLEEYNKLLQLRIDTFHILEASQRITKHIWANRFFNTLLFFIAQSIFSILGLFYLGNSQLWPLLLAMSIAMLLEGAFATYLAFLSISIVSP